MHALLAPCVYAAWTSCCRRPPQGATGELLAPPLTAAVLLAGDHRGWPVEAALLPLWTRLRLTTLWHLWRASRPGALDAGAQPLTAIRVASSILHDCRGAIQRDFTRVSSLIDCDMGVPMAWLRGRSPTMELTQFQAPLVPPRGPLPCGVRPRSGAALDSRAPRAPPH